MSGICNEPTCRFSSRRKRLLIGIIARGGWIEQIFLFLVLASSSFFKLFFSYYVWCESMSGSFMWKKFKCLFAYYVLYVQTCDSNSIVDLCGSILHMKKKLISIIDLRCFINLYRLASIFLKRERTANKKWLMK